MRPPGPGDSRVAAGRSVEEARRARLRRGGSPGSLRDGPVRSRRVSVWSFRCVLSRDAFVSSRCVVSTRRLGSSCSLALRVVSLPDRSPAPRRPTLDRLAVLHCLSPRPALSESLSCTDFSRRSRHPRPCSDLVRPVSPAPRTWHHSLSHTSLAGRPSPTSKAVRHVIPPRGDVSSPSRRAKRRRGEGRERPTGSGSVAMTGFLDNEYVCTRLHRNHSSRHLAPIAAWWTS